MEKAKVTLTMWVDTRPLTFEGDPMHVSDQIRGLRAQRFELKCHGEVGDLPGLRHLLLMIEETFA